MTLKKKKEADNNILYVLAGFKDGRWVAKYSDTDKQEVQFELDELLEESGWRDDHLKIIETTKLNKEQDIAALNTNDPEGLAKLTKEAKTIYVLLERVDGLWTHNYTSNKKSVKATFEEYMEDGESEDDFEIIETTREDKQKVIDEKNASITGEFFTIYEGLARKGGNSDLATTLKEAEVLYAKKFGLTVEPGDAYLAWDVVMRRSSDNAPLVHKAINTGIYVVKVR